MKRCSKCELKKRTGCFYKDKKYLSGLSSWCKECSCRTANRRLSKNRKSINKHRRKLHAALRLEILKYYSGSEKPSCACCGVKSQEFLAVDHIKGSGARHLRKIGKGNFYKWIKQHKFPEGFRILCHNCNQSLGHYGYCPHDSK